jgi:hypothetical protein
MAFMEGVPSEEPVALKYMLGYFPFYPRHLVGHQTLLRISKETVGGTGETGYENHLLAGSVLPVLYMSHKLVICVSRAKRLSWQIDLPNGVAHASRIV